MALQFFSDTVGDDASPIDFGAGDGELSSQRLECSITHCFVILRYGSLISRFSFHHLFDDFFCGRGFVSGGAQINFNLFTANQLNVAIFIIVNLNFENATKLDSGRSNIGGPNTPPPPVPEVFRFELMIFDAGDEGGGRTGRFGRTVSSENGTHTMRIVIVAIIEKFHI